MIGMAKTTECNKIQYIYMPTGRVLNAGEDDTVDDVDTHHIYLVQYHIREVCIIVVLCSQQQHGGKALVDAQGVG